MGWFGGNNWSSTQDIVDELVRDSKPKRYCLRKEGGRKVLWMVRNHPKVGDIITCDLIEGLSYKPMDESVGPFYYTCPLGYLKQTTVLNQKWRDNVVAYHALVKQGLDGSKASRLIASNYNQ